ncbi:MAG: response regulator [SAR202 cluster bacterium]|nr:response regulator [SAR202 cluster bacterium]
MNRGVDYPKHGQKPFDPPHCHPRDGITTARILIVDGSKEVRAALGTLLALQGHNVSYAEDGAGVAALVRADRPALILLDILKPGLEGFGVLARLRADHTTRNIPATVITALADVADQSRAVFGGHRLHRGAVLGNGRACPGRSGAAPPEWIIRRCVMGSGGPDVVSYNAPHAQRPQLRDQLAGYVSPLVPAQVLGGVPLRRSSEG